MRHVEGVTHSAAIKNELVYTSLTKAQHLIWLGQVLNADAPLYNMVHSFEIQGALKLEWFEAAMTSLVNDCDALRTTFHMMDGEPKQTVCPAVDAKLEFVDLSGREDPSHAAREWIDSRRTRLLRLEDRAFDTALLKLDGERFVWYWCHHHIIADAQAFELTFRYLADRYELASEGRLEEASELPSYQDYITFESSFTQTKAFQKARDHWGKVAGESMPVPTLYGAVEGKHGARARRVVLNVDKARSQALRSLCEAEPFRLLSEQLSLHAIWATLAFVTIHRITGQRRIRFGTPFQARPTPAFKQTVGLFIEIGALSLELEDDEPFSAVHARVVEEVLAGLRNAKPGTSSAALNRSYSILFNYVTARFGSFAGMPATTEWIHSGHGDAQHYLRFQVTDFADDGAFAVHLDLHEAQFDAVRETWLKTQLLAVVDAFLSNPARGIGSFGLSSPEQIQALVHDYNATEKRYGQSETVLALLADAVRTSPDAIAVREGQDELSYAQLDRLSNDLASTLCASGAGSGTRVGLCLPRSLEAVVTIWGVLKTGAAFVPLDLNLPQARIGDLLEDLSPAAIVVLREERRTIQSPSGCAVIRFDRQFHADARPGWSAPVVGAADPAYLIYTSGSTGMPKAAVLGHEGLNNYVRWATQTYRSEGSMDFALHSSLSFDLTLTSIFVPVATGSKVVVYPEKAEAGGLEVLDVFADGEVDVVKLTPAHLEILRETRFSDGRIKTLIVGGEDFKTGLAGSIQNNGPAGLQIYNEYGPTEATIGCMVHRFDAKTDKGGSVPIGVPAANMQVVVADPYGHPAPPGVIGEMMVSGPGVALSYWNRPELSEASFSATGTLRTYRTGDLARWTEAGLEFLGRRDNQIKHNGYRIELGEIEAALAAVPGLKSGAVKVTGKTEEGRDGPAYCLACGISSRTPGSDLDDKGVCKDCRDYEVLSDQVERYFNTPDDLRQVLRQGGTSTGAQYDCVVLTSGGKDSTYMLYQMVREFGVRPMVFTLDNGYLSERAISNVKEACEDLGVDLEVGSTPHMGDIFADSLRRHCNVCNGCFKTIYTLSMSLARRIGVSTIVTGLSRGQLFETRLSDTFRARQFDPDQIDRMVTDARKVYHHVDDAVYRLLDTALFEDDRIFDEIRFIDFYRYVDVPLSEVYDYLEQKTVWRRPEDTGRSTNCLINDAGIYVHNRVRGYHNYALPYSWDVRLGHKERLVAMDELDDEIDEGRVREILREIGYEEPPVQTRGAGVLTAYYVGGAELSHAAIRARLQERLPQHMVPATFVRMESMPLTANGKIDREALPEPGGGRSDLDTAFVEPASAVEKKLAAIWSSVIDVEPIGVEDNFFALGGDSVMSIQIAAQAGKSGMDMTPRMLFLYPTIATLARHIGQPSQAPKTDQSSAKAQLISPRDREQLKRLVGEPEYQSWEDVFPLSATQAGMLYQTLASDEDGVYIGQARWVLRGDIDLGVLHQAYELLVERHAVLRTRVVWEGLSEPAQAVCTPGLCAVETLDWRSQTTEEAERKFEKRWQRNWEKGFDLKGGPPIHLVLAAAPEDTVLVLWATHHLLFDGWSATPLFAEWLALYDALLTGTKPLLENPRPYVDFVRWQRQQDQAVGLDFWHTTLEGLESGTRLPIGQIALNPTARRHHHTVNLGLESSRALRKLAASCRVTLNALFQCAWGLLLSRYCRKSDVVFGATFSGRNGELAGVDRMIGLFINTLPMRMKIDEKASLESWLAQVQANLLAASEYEHVPLAKVQRIPRLAPDESVFDSIMVFENFPEKIESQSPNIAADQPRFTTPSHFPLAILVYPDEGLQFELIYDPSRFSDQVMAQLGQHLTNLLNAMIEGRSRTVGELNMLGDEESLALAFAPDLPGPELQGEIGLLQQIEVQANQLDTAVEGESGSLTYGELFSLANGIGNALLQAGVTPGEVVGIETARRHETLAGMLGIWKAGAAFVPLDSTQPAHRIQAIVDDASVRVAVTTSPSLQNLTSVRADQVQSESTGPVVETKAGDLAYVLYTSGSTGAPKGVMVSHGNIAASTRARLEVYPGRVSRFLHLSPLAFDSAMAGLFWTLLDGGCLQFAPDEVVQDATKLAALIETRAVSHLLTLPRFYAVVLDAAEPGQLAGLEAAVVAGEACPASLPARHYAACPNAVLYNEYGPTEATVWSHVYAVPSEFSHSSVPIGTAIPGMTHYLVDHALRLVPVGVPGELLLAGPGIAAGYLGQQSLTAERFFELDTVPGKPRVYRTGDLVRLNDRNELEYLGRIDQQLKIRGFRVEPGEVEAALLEHEAVTEAAVLTTRLDGAERARLVAGIQADVSIDEAQLRRFLSARLPDFMIPELLLQVPVLPRLSNGKLDARSLTAQLNEQAAARPDFREPRTGIQRQVAAIWKTLLRLDSVGLDDNFVEAGGDSIVALQVVSRARTAGIQLNPADLIRCANLEALCELAGDIGRSGTSLKKIDRPAPLTPVESWFFELNNPNPDHWNMSGALRLAPEVDLERLTLTLRMLLERHTGLRTAYECKTNAWQRGRPTAVNEDLTIEKFKLSGAAPDFQDVGLTVRLRNIQRTLDLSRGILFKPVLLCFEEERWLALIVHHLAMDGVSWSVLLDELVNLYSSDHNTPSPIPPVTLRFNEWAHWLEDKSRSGTFDAELEYWVEQPWETALATSGSLSPVDNRESAAARYTSTGAADLIAALQSQASRGGVSVEVCLLAALCRSLFDPADGAPVLIGLEGHGRHSLGEAIDPSATLGWFTVQFPLLVPLKHGADVETDLKLLKELRQNVPSQGMGFGALRYLHGSEAVREKMAGIPTPGVLFNYLGNTDRTTATEVYSEFYGPLPGGRSDDAQRPALLELNVAVRHGQLECAWSFHREAYSYDAMGALDRSFISALGKIATFLETGSIGAIPADFPLADLSQDELDDLLDEL